MGANVGSGNGGGKVNYYSVSYGKLGSKVKDIPNGYDEMSESDLKAKTQAVEKIDLRKVYIDTKKGDYPYRIFYDSITGTILNHEVQTSDHGDSLNITLLDNDGEISILQMKMYSKYAENLLNRLLNTDTTSELSFYPYAVPNKSEIQGVEKTFYTQGVSVKCNGEKVEVKYVDKGKDNKSPLPDTEQVKVAGKMTTSRDERLDFLYKEFCKVFKPVEAQEVSQGKVDASNTQKSNIVAPPVMSNDDDDSELPF